MALDQDTLDDLERQRVRLEKQLEVDWARVIDDEDDDEEEAQ